MNPSCILVVEDEPFIAMDERSILRGLGYEVIAIVASGEEAIKLAEKRRPDLIIMDIKLAGEIDGLQAAVAIHEVNKIPVIFVTAYGNKQFNISENVSIPEYFGYIVKPFTEEELESEVKRLSAGPGLLRRQC